MPFNDFDDPDAPPLDFDDDDDAPFLAPPEDNEMGSAPRLHSNHLSFLAAAVNPLPRRPVAASGDATLAVPVPARRSKRERYAWSDDC